LAEQTPAVTGTGEDVASSISRRRRHARRAPSAGYLERQQRLLAAATEVLKEKGLDATSINDIAERIGADRASVYYYYGSKQEIFLALIRQAVGEVVLLAEGIAEEKGPSTDRLEQLVRSQLAAYERHYPYIQLYIQEDMNRVPGDGTAAGEELRDLGLRYEAAIERITRDGIEAGEFRAGLDAQLVAFAVLGAVNWTHRWFSPGGRLTGEQVGASFADIFLRGVSASR
jgi:AcrR family transcriptional regulator